MIWATLFIASLNPVESITPQPTLAASTPPFQENIWDSPSPWNEVWVYPPDGFRVKKWTIRTFTPKAELPPFHGGKTSWWKGGMGLPAWREVHYHVTVELLDFFGRGRTVSYWVIIRSDR